MDVTLADGRIIRCDDRPFTTGGEAEVFWEVGKAHVVKLYTAPGPHVRPTLENIMDRFNLVKEDPSRKSYFAWPESIVIKPKLGILMPTINAKPLEHYIRPAFWKTLPPDRKGTWQMRLSIAYRMARIMRWMHNRGLCHSDLSPKNFLVDIKTGQTTLLDCDGLVIPGLQPPSVLGTPQCMAPEIVMRKADPTVNSDKHALAVLIYWIFLLRHPLQGPKIHHQDPEKDEQLAYGANALYIEHPTDKSNHPDRLPVNSILMTPLVRSLLNRAFVDALHNPGKRPSAPEWEAALMRMADRIVPCMNPQCPMRAYVVPESPHFKCPWCGTAFSSPAGLPILQLYSQGSLTGVYGFDKWSIVGLRGRPVRMHHVDRRISPDTGGANTTIGHFDLDGRGRWYLTNDGLDSATVLDATISRSFKRGTSIELKSGLKIVMGSDPRFRVGFIQILPTHR